MRSAVSLLRLQMERQIRVRISRHLNKARQRVSFSAQENAYVVIYVVFAQLSSPRMWFTECFSLRTKTFSDPYLDGTLTKGEAMVTLLNNRWSWRDAAAHWDAAPDSMTPDRKMDAETLEELREFFRVALDDALRLEPH